MKSRSSLQILAEIIEKTVRKVVREELSKHTAPVVNNYTSKTSPKPNKPRNHSDILQSILEETQPFSRDELNENSYSTVETEYDYDIQPPTNIISPNMELDPATARIAEILNKSNHKAVFEASKKFKQ